jgi:hypothetical protein
MKDGPVLGKYPDPNPGGRIENPVEIGGAGRNRKVDSVP